MATWNLSTGSVFGNALTAGIACAAVVAVADTIGMHPIAGAGAAVVGALCTVLMSGFSNAEAIGVHLVRWLAAGVWVTVMMSLSSPWSLWSIGILAAGCVVGAAMGQMVRRRAAAAGEAGGRTMVLGSAARENDEWRQRIVDRGGQQFAGIVVEAVTKWDNSSGEDVRVCLPKAGATVDQLRYLAPGLAADANLPHGCSIEIIEPEGEGQRTVIMRVTTKLMTDTNILHPLWEEQRSILDGIPIGVHPNGDLAEAPAREESWLIVGRKGSGKTTTLHGITATVGMCRDALVWHIDLNGGGMSQPWLDLWLQGKVDRPPIDWAAPNVDEAIKLTRAAIRIAKDRKTSYRALKRKHNTNLLPVSEDLPEIVIMLDEGAEALAAAGKGKVAELGANLEEIQRIARNEAVNPILSVLRGTGDLVPAGMTTQTGVAICMKVRHQREIASVFEEAWDMKLQPHHLTSKGAGWLGVDGGLPRRKQSWNILPEQMDEQGRLISRVRSDLDESSAQAAGEDYATRYERMRKLFVEDAEVVEEEPEPVPTSGSWTSDWNLFGAGPEPSTPSSKSEGSSRVALPVGDDGIEDAEVVEESADDILVGALRVMADAGSDRATREQLAARLTGGDEGVLRERMKKAGAGSPHPVRINGKYERGWMRSDVEDAMSKTPA